MAFITDFEQIVDCSNVAGMAYSDWEPTLNDSGSTAPNYIENSACMFWPLSKGVTDGYGSFQAGSVSMSGKILVGFIMQTLADIGNIPVTELQLRFSSAAALATNYAAWDVLAQIVSPKNNPVSGLVPIICHEDNTVETGGTPNYSSIGYVGYLGTTGNNADGKQGWFDHFFTIGYVGEESADYATTPNTFFDQLAAECYDSDGAGGNTVPDQNDRPLGIFTKDVDVYTSNVNIQMASGSGDTALSVKETGKTIKWNNVHADHNIGYVFKKPATGDLDVEMIGSTNIWAIKQGSTAEIFTTPANAVDWKWDGGVFTRGGKATFPTYGATRHMKNSKFTDSGIVTPKDCVFEDNKVEDQAIGVAVVGTLATNRMKRTAYSGCDDAMQFDTAQTITLDGDKFSGNTYDIWFTGTGTLTINKINGANPTTSRVTGGGTVVINQPAVTLAFTVRDEGTDLPIEGAAATIETGATGDLPYNDSVTITRSGTTATVTHTGHGLSTGKKVAISGANQNEYNRIKTITVVSANSYTYTVEGSPATPATGTITATAIIIDGETDASGYISDTRAYTADQDYTGKIQKGTGTIIYTARPISGSLDKDTGASLTTLLTKD